MEYVDLMECFKDIDLLEEPVEGAVLTEEHIRKALEIRGPSDEEQRKLTEFIMKQEYKRRS